MKNIKIGFTGSHGVGKTTLARALYDVIKPGIPIIDYSRPTAAAKALGYNSSRDIPQDDKSQWDFQVAAMFEQLRAQNSAGNNSYIIDRTPIDFISYLCYRMPWLKGTEKYELYEKIGLEFTDFDYIFYVPPFGSEIQDNGIRFLSNPEPIGQEILRLMDKNNINYHYIKATTVKGRLDEVLRILGI